MGQTFRMDKHPQFYLYLESINLQFVCMSISSLTKFIYVVEFNYSMFFFQNEFENRFIVRLQIHAKEFDTLSSTGGYYLQCTFMSL